MSRFEETRPTRQETKVRTITNTGGEEKALNQLSKLRRTIDTIGGTDKANELRKELDVKLTECYCLLTGDEPKVGSARTTTS